MIKWKDFCVQKKPKPEASLTAFLPAPVRLLFTEVMTTTKDGKLLLALGYRYKH